jgi:hypothetical protein
LEEHQLALTGLVYVQIVALELFPVKEQNHVHHAPLENIIIMKQEWVFVYILLVEIVMLDLIQLEERLRVHFVIAEVTLQLQGQPRVLFVSLERIHTATGLLHVPNVQLEDIHPSQGLLHVIPNVQLVHPTRTWVVRLLAHV